MTNGFQKKIKKRTDTLVQKKYLVQLNISALNTHLKTNQKNGEDGADLALVIDAVDVDDVPLLDGLGDAAVAVLRHGTFAIALNVFLLTCSGKEFYHRGYSNNT